SDAGVASESPPCREFNCALKVLAEAALRQYSCPQYIRPCCRRKVAPLRAVTSSSSRGPRVPAGQDGRLHRFCGSSFYRPENVGSLGKDSFCYQTGQTYAAELYRPSGRPALRALPAVVFALAGGLFTDVAGDA